MLLLLLRKNGLVAMLETLYTVHRLAQPPHPRPPTTMKTNCAYTSVCARPAEGVFANTYTGVDDTCSQMSMLVFKTPVLHTNV